MHVLSVSRGITTRSNASAWEIHFNPRREDDAWVSDLETWYTESGWIAPSDLPPAPEGQRWLGPVPERVLETSFRGNDPGEMLYIDGPGQLCGRRPVFGLGWARERLGLDPGLSAELFQAKGQYDPLWSVPAHLAPDGLYVLVHVGAADPDPEDDERGDQALRALLAEAAAL